MPEGFVEAGHETLLTETLSEENITNKIIHFKPHFAVSLGWGIEQWKKNQLLIRKCVKKANLPHVYWSIEDPAYTFTFSLPLIQTMQPDFVFSICPATVEFYRKAGIQSAYMDFGFAPKIHKHIECADTYKTSVAVVANAYPDILEKYPKHYRHISMATLITPLLKNNIKIDFWGKNWDRVKQYIKYEIPREWIHGYIPYKDANKVYCSADIVLGLQNYLTQITQRTYEILASGGFLLTSDTPVVRCMFQSGKQLITSSSPDETVQLVKYYLDKPHERAKISRCGEASLSGNSYKERAEYMIRILKENNIINI